LDPGVDFLDPLIDLPVGEQEYILPSDIQG